MRDAILIPVSVEGAGRTRTIPCPNLQTKRRICRRGTALSTSERERSLPADRRRLALECLSGQSTPVELEELAAEIAAREDESTVVDEKTIERVATTLHHTHLPKLAAVGVLDYDPTSHRIDPDEDPDPTRGESTRPSTDESVAITDQHRRLVFEYLAQNEQTTLTELSTEIADEDTQTGDAPTSTTATQFHHNHLPRLDDAGFIHYDPDDHTIETTERISGRTTDLLDAEQRE
jgi:hypothetical protein